MKRIRTLQNIPPSLADYLEQRGGNATWLDFRNHDNGRAYRDLRHELTTLQHGLCGYCEISLPQNRPRQIEHVASQKRHQNLALEITNLIVCCFGGSQPLSEQDDPAAEDEFAEPVNINLSCGQAKDNYDGPEFVDPRTVPAMPSLVKVRLTGEIEADEAACQKHGISVEKVCRTIKILGLNVRRLRLAREKRWKALAKVWQRDYEDKQIMYAAARKELLPDNTERLSGFFTTSRCYFREVGEQVLAQAPQSWI